MKTIVCRVALAAIESLCNYLEKYLGQYLQALDADCLQFSVWRGDVELRHLSLRAETPQYYLPKI